MPSANQLPPIIQGGMGVAVSSWHLAKVVSEAGQLGVVSGTALDLVFVRRLQDGDEGGHIRRALSHFPVPAVAEKILARYFRPEGRPPGTPYAPIPSLVMKQSATTQQVGVLGAFAEVWLAKEGHDGVVGINCLEKIQLATPSTVYGAMLANVDAVLMGAGVPRDLPALMNSLAKQEAVEFPIDVAGASDGEFTLRFDPAVVLETTLPPIPRPIFLAIVSSHVLAAYLARDEAIRPDGFIVEASPAGGHNAPPRRPQIDERGEVVFGPRDEPDLAKISDAGLPYWVAGAAGTPDAFREALAAGAMGVQVGTVFALCSDSGLIPQIREELLDGIRDGSLHVRTDPLASPTGFPFKVAALPLTIAEPATYQARERLCDLAYLRTPYRKDEGDVGYRCPSEPLHMYERKGGDLADTVGRACLCNGLTATVGLGQTRRDGYTEAPIVTLGSDLVAARGLMAQYPDGWTATQVIEWILTP